MKSVEIDLPEHLTIANIHPLHELLESMVDDQGYDQITIRAEAVQRADTAGVQLLYAFVLATRERKILLKWDKPSAKLVGAAEVLGMKESLGMD